MSNQISRPSRLRRASSFIVLCSFAVLSGCSPEKAKQLKYAAGEFRTHALATVQVLQGVLDAEIAPVPRTEVQKANEFVTGLLAVPADQAVTEADIEFAIDPYTVHLSSIVVVERRESLTKLQKRLNSFAAIFDELDQASYFSAKPVKDSRKYVVDLIANLLGIADFINENPPVLSQYRNSLVSQFNLARKDPSLSPEDRKSRLIDLMNQWLALKNHERELQRSVSESAVQAATLGETVLNLIDSYGKFSPDDIFREFDHGLSAASALSGRDLSHLKGEASRLESVMQNDPMWSGAAALGASELNSRIRGDKSK